MAKVRYAVLLSLVAIGGIALGVAGRDWILHVTGQHGAHVTAEGDAEAGQLWTCSMHPQVIQDGPGTCPICQMALEPLKTKGEGGGEAAAERRVLYWTDPMMSPPYVSDKPGKSPMGMDLVPVYADEHVHSPAVQIDPAVVQNIGLRVAGVKHGPITETVRAVGVLTEPDWAHYDVNLRVSGWITKLHANMDGMAVKKGDVLFDLYSPDLQLAIEELIAAREAGKALGEGADGVARRAAEEMVATARRKLALWGIEAEQIERFETMQKAPPAVAFLSPMDGHVTEKSVYEGAAVKAGDRVLRLADNATLWLDLQVYEKDLPLVKKDAEVTAAIEGVRDPMKGKVIFFHPHVNPETRTALVRVEIANSSRELRQGMYATAQIKGPVMDDVLTIPREAVIDTGNRKIVFVSTGKGEFEPRDVKTGLSTTGGTVQVLAGLGPQETVVTSGQFLLDSESRLKEAVQKHLRDKLLAKKPAGTPAGAHAQHGDSGTPRGASSRPSEPVDAAVLAQVDALTMAYLQMAKVLGAPQAEGAEPLNVTPLREAAEALAKRGSGETKAWASVVATGTAAIEGKPLEAQRKGFKGISDAMIALAERQPPSRAVSAKLYVVECTMAPGQWLQTSDRIANPYYATAMKACGSVLRTIDATDDKHH